MFWKSDLTEKQWVRNEQGQVLLFCPGCHDEVYAEHMTDGFSFRLECDVCGAVYDIDEMNADFYQPTWP